MLPRASKELLVRLGSYVRPLFQGRYLLLTNTLSGGGTLALGDVLQQTWHNREQDRVQEWSRTGRTFVVGCSMSPFLHYWYMWLDKVYAGKTLKIIGKKILADQVIGTPVVAVAFFLGMDLMEGQTLSQAWEEFRNKFWELYKMDWYVWPPAQMLNFYYVSPKLRVLYIYTVGVGWDTYLSYVKHRGQ